MDYRPWLFNKLTGSSALQAIVDDRIFTVLDANDTPADKPFVVLRFGEKFTNVPTTEEQRVTIWVHDEPTSYVRIDETLSVLRDELEGPIANAEGGVFATWEGDSIDLADDARGTYVRNSGYRLAGRR